MFVCVSTSRVLVTSVLMWRDMDLHTYDWLTKFYSSLMAAVVNIVSGHGLSIDVRHANQPNKSKLLFYKPIIHIYNCLQQLHIRNKMIHFSYKGEHGCHTHINVF